ncbi:hypothetical protein R1sor_020394 [Riccia sorocarpa]|uniref:Uncharacterized protein n=1 Tax=Riccia sorocarpa TaxID=122646 RepID=A0ABD3IJR1_9MARC
MLTSKEAIMRELHMYYIKLFKEEMVIDPDMRKLDEVLNLMDSKVTHEQNRQLSTLPEVEEIKDIVQELKMEKAPGLDGMTAEALRGLDEDAEKDLLQMMLTFWEDPRLSWKQQQGVIKLIPKERDLQARRKSCGKGRWELEAKKISNLNDVWWSASDGAGARPGA